MQSFQITIQCKYDPKDEQGEESFGLSEMPTKCIPPITANPLQKEFYLVGEVENKPEIDSFNRSGAKSIL